MKDNIWRVIIVCVVIYFIVTAIGANELQSLQEEESLLHIKVLKLQLGE